MQEHSLLSSPGTVLITGATGFVGSSLVELYARCGWRVVGTYRETDKDRSWVPADVELRPVDLLDRPAVAELVVSVRPDVVQHLAAQSSVARSWQDPMGTVVGNVGCQYNVLEAVREHRAEAGVVVVGSCDEYGDVAPEENPVAETHQLRPLTPYALSKATQDLMGYQYARSWLMRVMRVRPFLQLGPRRPASFAVGSFARQVAEIERGLRKPEIRVGNIDLVRDFTDVRDVARALALVAERGTSSEVYNIASGTGHSLREVIHLMLRDAGVEARIHQDPELMRAGEMPRLIGDTSRLRRATGWAPETSFEQSARDTLAYWRQRIEQALIAGRERG